MIKLPGSVIFTFLIFFSCSRNPETDIEIRGIYGDPQPIWDKAYNFTELGVNAVFVHAGSIDHEMMARARRENAMVFAEFPTLNGKGYVEEHPEAWAINDKGEKVEAASWFMGVCPTEPGFKIFRHNQLRELLADFDIDGVWMDYVHWHAQFEESEPILPETCFCDHCLSSFSKDTGLKIPDVSTPEKARWIFENVDKQWRDWRCKVILDWAVEIRNVIQEIKPGILLGIYHCPWTDDEFDGARRRILGLDFDLLRNFFDVFSPMVYHARMGRDPGWVKENVEWFCDRMSIENKKFPRVWPIVQAYNNPGVVSASEFETVLKGGLASKSSGVMMFTTRAVADDEEKINVVKKIYREIQ